ncbi:PQQ-dependent sugar dehydrogenase [Mucilaginibacter hurinus]|nr:PQQ-dependent sugar dehydrogenase [Mucilaginibacter hurinus]
MMISNRAEKVHVAGMPVDTEQNRFTKTVLAEKLDEPLQMLIFKDNKVLFIERKGNVKLYNPETKTTSVIAVIPVSTKYKSREGKISEAEDGLLGVIADPGFDKNHWLYLYYSAAGDEAKNILVRYEYVNDKLIESSKKIVLEVPVQREQCCHTGGKMAFDKDNNLYLTTGDNTSSKATGYSPSDEREGRSPWDAQGTSANTNDLRGKILRIHPEPDGTYTVPDGNLFPKDMAKTRPEIYVMGIRNPYSIFVDKRSGYLYWGEVGPDAGRDSANRGPRSYDEYNRTNKPGFFGWPYFGADNKAYHKVDFSTGMSKGKYNPDKPLNTSPNNTGLNELPPAQKALIWYSYEKSEEFPLLGTGGRSAMLGPVYYAEDYASSAKRFPDYYNNKLFIFEWLRDWILTVNFDENGNYQSMERFLPGMRFSHPMDLKFGPDGDMYVLEYGQGWFTQNNDAQLVHITYNAGNRKPNVMAAADKTVGGLPLKVNFSSAGTHDFDNDKLTYKWTVITPSGARIPLKGENPAYTFLKKGVYKAVLTVTDVKGASASKTVSIKAGNQPPVINIAVSGNQLYYFPGKPVNYKVTMRDKEDGIIPGGKLPQSKLKVSITQTGSEKGANTPGHRYGPENFTEGKSLMLKSDCKACHDDKRKVIGPSYTAIAAKYSDEPANVEKLAAKIISGGNGVWGEMNMSAHPQMPKDDAKAIVRYILNIASADATPANLPPAGTYDPGNKDGLLTVKAAYTDKGIPGIPSAFTEAAYILNSPVLNAANGKFSGDFQVHNKVNGRSAVLVKKAGNITYENIDLTGVSGFDLNVSTPGKTSGGAIELRFNNPEGKLVGSVTVAKGVERHNIRVNLANLFSGKHNLCLVFTGPDTKEGILYIDTITLLAR